jgi:hypothetical protein
VQVVVVLIFLLVVFSHINADQFVASLRAIGQNAKSLAMMMAIKIVTTARRFNE